jgi:hypothetical protein
MLQLGHSPYSIGNKALQRLQLNVVSLIEDFPSDNFGFFSRYTSAINYIGKSSTLGSSQSLAKTLSTKLMILLIFLKNFIFLFSIKCKFETKYYNLLLVL